MQASRKTKTRALCLPLALVLLLTIGTAAVYAGPGSKDEAKGYIGVYMQKLTKEVREGLDLDVKRGILVSGVEDGSPAEKAGLEDGDVIIMFNGKKVDYPDELRELVEETAVGKEVKLKVIREGDEKDIKVVIGERPDRVGWITTGDEGDLFFGDNVASFVSDLFPGPMLGVEVAGLNDDLASYFDTKEDGGVLVLDVNEESIAEESGIKPGDIIQEIDGEKITSIKELRQSLKDFDEGDKFEIKVLRHGDRKTLAATMDDQKPHKFLRGRISAPHFETWDVPRLKLEKRYDSPRVKVYEFEDDLKKEMKELKEELKKLKKELREMKEG